MTTIASRKSGTLTNRQRVTRRVSRDVKILRMIRVCELGSKSRHLIYREPVEPLSVYLGKAGSRSGMRLTQFPIRYQGDGRPMPAWNDLSPWMKAQVAVITFHNWAFLTFNMHVHPDLETLWIAEGADVRSKIRDRLRRELDKAVGARREHFFVVEGWSKSTKSETFLHIHGSAAIIDPGDDAKIKTAAARACGHTQGRAAMRRAIHATRFTRAGPRYINYLLKSVRRHDERLAVRRFSMSRSATQAAREMWEAITGN